MGGGLLHGDRLKRGLKREELKEKEIFSIRSSDLEGVKKKGSATRFPEGAK